MWCARHTNRYKTPQNRYMHGWGVNLSDAKPIVRSWDLQIKDSKRKPTTLSFHVTKGNAPIIFGLHMIRYESKLSTAQRPRTIFRRPEGKGERKLNIYISQDENRSIRNPLKFLSREGSDIGTMMAHADHRGNVDFIIKYTAWTMQPHMKLCPYYKTLDH